MSVKECMWWGDGLLFYGHWPVMDYYVQYKKGKIKSPVYETAQHMWTEHQRLDDHHLEQKTSREIG